jgi:hypothetical protein
LTGSRIEATLFPYFLEMEEEVLRMRSPCTVKVPSWAAAALLLILPLGAAANATTTGTTPPTLPVLALGEWRVLALDGGLFFARPGAGGDIGFVYGTDGGNHKEPLQLISYAGGGDPMPAIEALPQAVPVSSADYDHLKAFATQLGWPSDGKTGSWAGMTYDQGLDLAAKSDLGIFNPLVSLSLSASAKASKSGLAAVSVGYCKAASLVDAAATKSAAAASAVDVATPESTRLFEKQAAAACADIFPTYIPTKPPAFPYYPPPAVPPAPWVPPSGPGTPVWVGQDCTNFGQQAQCVNRIGQQCMCSCEGASSPGQWINPTGCVAIPSNPPASPCTPPGGIGPCDNQCACDCVATPGTPPGSPGTWGPKQCGFEPAAYGLLLVTGLLGLYLRRRSRGLAATR